MSFNWKIFKIGAGGYLRGGDVAPDGTRVVRTDTYGSFIWDPAAPSMGNAGGLGNWRQLFQISAMPAGHPVLSDAVQSAMWANFGTYEVRIAPSSTNILYMLHWRYLFKSVNRGVNWTATGFTPITDCYANAGESANGPKMAIDPQNPNICFVGTHIDGLFVTRDGGTTVPKVTTIPTSTGTGYGIAYDPASSTGTVGGVTAKLGIYAMVDGSGVYHSTDGGQTWALMSGSPTKFFKIKCDQSGTLWVVDNGTLNGAQSLHRYRSGTWFNCPLSINTSVGDIAIDPTNANRIVAMDQGGQLAQSLDGGNSWSIAGQPNWNRVATDIPWLATTLENWMTCGEIHFDPSRTNTLCFAQGVGYWEQNPSLTNPIQIGTWTSFNSGNEQLVVNTVKKAPGGKPCISVWDRAVFVSDDPNVYPSAQGLQSPTQAIIEGYDCDYASSDPNYFAVWGAGGYSPDAGATWHQYTNQPSLTGYGGCIACASPTNTVVAPFMGGLPYVTNDGGVTWGPCNISGLSAFSRVYWDYLQILAADRVNIGTFYLFDFNTNNIFKSTANGASGTWTQSTPGFSVDGALPQIRAVPGYGGHVIWTAGVPYNIGSISAHIMYRTQNGGSSWADVSNGTYTVRGVTCFGFGAVKAGQSYPRIGIYGSVNGVIGMWETADNFATWQMLGDKHFNGFTMDYPKSMDAGMAEGSWIVGFQGSGCVYGYNASNSYSLAMAVGSRALSGGATGLSKSAPNWITHLRYKRQ